MKINDDSQIARRIALTVLDEINPATNGFIIDLAGTITAGIAFNMQAALTQTLDREPTRVELVAAMADIIAQSANQYLETNDITLAPQTIKKATS